MLTNSIMWAISTRDTSRPLGMWFGPVPSQVVYVDTRYHDRCTRTDTFHMSGGRGIDFFGCPGGPPGLSVGRNEVYAVGGCDEEGTFIPPNPSLFVPKALPPHVGPLPPYHLPTPPPLPFLSLPFPPTRYVKLVGPQNLTPRGLVWCRQH